MTKMAARHGPVLRKAEGNILGEVLNFEVNVNEIQMAM